MKNLEYLLALHSIEGLGSVRLKFLLEHFHDPKLIWQAGKSELLKYHFPDKLVYKLVEARQKISPLDYYQNLTNQKIQVLTVFDQASYPVNLSNLTNPPLILYYRGKFSADDKQSIGVVGSRKMTSYGHSITRHLVEQLAESGLTIVSGLARGVDTLAHQSSLGVRGRTLAVLGGGLNQLYPPENQSLALDIAQSGAVLSEFPPEYPPLPGNFPARNRIIAGLSKAILVTEAAIDSGSLITAKEALDQGKDVFAVPGPINSQFSEGPHLLIKNGAKLVDNVADILDEFNLTNQSKPMINISLTEDEKLVLECLSSGPKHIDEICRQVKRPTSQISGILIKLEILGLIQSLGQGQYTICA